MANIANRLFVLARQFGLKQSVRNLSRNIFTNESKPCEKTLSIIDLNKQIHSFKTRTEINGKFLPIIFNKETKIEWKQEYIDKNNDTLSYIEFPDLTKLWKIEPFYNTVNGLDMSISLPTREQIVDKHAHRMINIRRKKMKKHKRRKLIKKMKFVWRKQRLRRKTKREKEFRAELAAQIRQAEKFNAEQYVLDRLEILSRKKPDIFWRGELLPEAMVKEFKEKKLRRKEARLNRPRLKLD